MNIEERMDRSESYEQIRQLAYRYAVSVDSRDMKTLAGLFAEGAVFGGQSMTTEEIEARFGNMLAESPLSILNVGNHLIDLDADDANKAKGTVYCRAEIEDGERWLVQQIVYLDTYVRQKGKWLFWERQHLLFYGADLLQRPIGLHPAGKPENQDGKGSMPQIWPTYGEYWKKYPGKNHY